MQEFLKKAILRLFPELSGGLHLDRYGRVLAIADAPAAGAASERFRPRLAADIEILTPDMEPDPAFPQYTAVPLPVPMGAGGEAGIFAPPRPGALVVVGFAYGRQDHPVIRQIYGMGESLPQVAPGDMLLQQSPTVFQRADAGGNWSRETDAAIIDKSVSRRVEAMNSETDLAREVKRISEHSNVEIDGAGTLEVGTQLTMLAGKRADLGTLGEMNLTAAGDSTSSTGKNAVETVGGNHSSRVKLNRDVTIEGGRVENVAKGQVTAISQGRNETIGADQALEVGGDHTDIADGDRLIEAANIILRAGTFTIVSNGKGGSINLYGELLDCLADIRRALDVLATHDHPNTGTINQGGAVASEAASAEGHRQKMKGITG
jgi:hypothetical protein